MKKILISGDSFATDWTKKYENSVGWVNMFGENYEIKNIAEAGVSEYKIYKQLESVNLNEFDNIIVTHTSAYRIPIEEHPIHKNDLLHYNCDLIFSDVKEHLKNPIMKTAYEFYSEIFYVDYFIFVNKLIYEKIYNMIPSALHITFFDSFYDESVLKLEKIFLKNKGFVNHLNDKGNKIVYEKILKLLK